MSALDCWDKVEKMAKRKGIKIEHQDYMSFCMDNESLLVDGIISPENMPGSFILEKMREMRKKS